MLLRLRPPTGESGPRDAGISRDGGDCVALLRYISHRLRGRQVFSARPIKDQSRTPLFAPDSGTKKIDTQNFIRSSASLMNFIMPNQSPHAATGQREGKETIPEKDTVEGQSSVKG